MSELNLIKQDESLEPVAFDVDGDGAITALDEEASKAFAEVYEALKKLGVSEDAMLLVFGIEPPDVRQSRLEKRASKRKSFKAAAAPVEGLVAKASRAVRAAIK